MGERLVTMSYHMQHIISDGAIMYVTKDIFNDSYVVAIPYINFCAHIFDNYDLERLLKYNILRDYKKQQEMIQIIKQAMSDFN